jgi:hypothetical protein
MSILVVGDRVAGSVLLVAFMAAVMSAISGWFIPREADRFGSLREALEKAGYCFHWIVLRHYRAQIYRFGLWVALPLFLLWHLLVRPLLV